MRSYEYMDPARVLEIRGEDCDNCVSLKRDKVFVEWIKFCDNHDAPAEKRENAPESRCYLWKHRQGVKNA